MGAWNEEGVALVSRVADALDVFVDNHHRAARRVAVWSALKWLFIAVCVVAFAAFYWALYSPLLGAKADPYQPSVVVIEITGQIGKDAASAKKIVPLIQRACRQEMARGLVLKINSPGGSPTDAEQVMAALAACRKDHPDLPMLAVIEQVGASAALLIAAETGEVVANRYALVGSIGAVSVSMDVSSAAAQLGLAERVYASGPLKAGGSLLSANTPEQDAMMQALVDESARIFAGQVTASRGDRLKLDTPDLFSGRVWLADEALAIGLIDQVAVMDELMVERFPGLPTHTYRPTKTVGELINLKSMASGVAQAVVAELREVRVE